MSFVLDFSDSSKVSQNMNDKMLLWLSNYLVAQEQEVRKLLDNEIARYFLIVWSIYEAKCFKEGFGKKEIEKFAAQTEKLIDLNLIDDYAKYFHIRYQDRNKYENLLHKHEFPRLDKIINSKYDTLNANDKIYLLVVVTNRYRNNIFHGSKGIESWLQFDEQIRKCIEVIQQFIDGSVIKDFA